MRYFAIALFLSVALVACDDDPTSVTPALDKEIPVEVDERVLFDEEGFAIHFREVVNDSRCPKGLTCVWAGNAKIRIEVESLLRSAPTRTFELNTYLEPQQASYAGYTIHLISLAPYPHVDKDIEPGAYEVTLKITRNASVD